MSDKAATHEGWIHTRITSVKSVPAYAGSADESGWLWRISLTANIGYADEPEISVGSLLAYRSDVSAAWLDGENLFDAFDQHSSDLALMALSVMDEEGEWRPFLNSQFELFGCDVLYIDRVKVSPLLRGRKLGLALVERCISLEGHGCGLVVLDPLPEQFYYNYETQEPRDLGRPDIQEAMKRVSRYFGRLGFRRIRGSRFLGYDPSQQNPTPRKLGLVDDTFDHRWDDRLLEALRKEGSESSAVTERLKSLEKKDGVEQRAQAENIRALIERGENDTVEFKESLVWDVRQDRFNLVMRDEVLKEICAFLNAGGGTIFCGVDDSGSAKGIAKDLKHYGGNKDKLGLVLINALGDLLKPHPVELVRLSFVELDGETILRIDVSGDPSTLYQSPSTKKDDAGKNIPRAHVRLHGAAKALEGQDLLNWWARRQQM